MLVPFLSICIPTRNRTEVVIRTLDSIFSSNVSLLEYEVVIYDSSDDELLSEIINQRFRQVNLKYKRGENLGFLNLIEALKMGSGLLLKLHNDYCEFESQSLYALLGIIKNAIAEKPLLFFTNGSLKNKHICEYDSFNEFIYNASFYTSWSTAFCIWKDDFIRITNISLEPMFPHTSLLFNLPEKKRYVLNNSILFKYQKLDKKGGYNLFETFAVCYLRMLEELLSQNRITINTFEYIKKDLFNFFLVQWYCNTKLVNNNYSFVLSDVKRSMSVYYSPVYYPLLIAFAYLHLLKLKVKSVAKWINGK